MFDKGLEYIFYASEILLTQCKSYVPGRAMLQVLNLFNLRLLRQRFIFIWITKSHRFKQSQLIRLETNTELFKSAS